MNKKYNMKAITIILEKVSVVFLLLALMFSMTFMACSEEDDFGIPKKDDIAPGLPTVKNVRNINGGAVVYFDAPTDRDLMCIVASYEINNKMYETKTSPHVDSLLVEGFGEIGEYQVYLEAYDLSNNKSSKVPVKINPLVSPVDVVYESLSIQSGFGGLELAWENKTEANLVLSVTVKDSLGDWQELESFYTSSEIGKGTIRGMDTTEVVVRVQIKDRWNNYSEFNESTQNPIFEIMADKKLFEEEFIEGDTEDWPDGSYPLKYLWDNIQDGSNCFHSTDQDGGAMEKCITFDMGQVMKLSRFRMLHRYGANNVWLYTHNHVKRFSIYGSKVLTDDMRTSGTLDDWTPILENASTGKPSGEGPATGEDYEYAKKGDEYGVDFSLESFRYIRIKFHENWSGGILVQIGEMDFYGQPDKD